MNIKQDAFSLFESLTVTEIQGLLMKATSRAENLFYQRILSLKMGLLQEEVVGEELL